MPSQANPNQSKSVYFGGSRALSSAPLVGQVVRAVLSAGQSVHVGCASGADALVISAASLSQSSLSVFAVGGSGGQGFWSGSAPLALLQAVKPSVSWWAGGGPSVPLRARLIKRSCAGFAGCSQAVFFLASPNSKGSLAVAARAAQTGLPVFVFSVGFSSAPAPLSGQAGQWVSGSFLSFSCWQWQSAQPSLF